MPQIDAHAPGSFCWIELGTNDQEGAKVFYHALLGWHATDAPMGPGETYTMFDIAGAGSGAAYRSGQGVFWNLYIAVADADATAKQAESLGGTLLKAPFDVFTYGRMAVIQDPTGAAFCIWQARSHKGLDAVGEEGMFCWADLSTPDVAKAKEFYTGLFGWKMFADPHDPSGYLHIQNGVEVIGGVPSAEQRNPQAPPHWLIYFQTVDCDGSVKKAEEHGARVYMPPLSMPNVGRFAVLADSAGAMFALFEPQNAA
jgi:predicted enzyme related to lactoylglutathione lyase